MVVEQAGVAGQPIFRVASSHLQHKEQSEPQGGMRHGQQAVGTSLSSHPRTTLGSGTGLRHSRVLPSPSQPWSSGMQEGRASLLLHQLSGTLLGTLLLPALSRSCTQPAAPVTAVPHPEEKPLCGCCQASTAERTRVLCLLNTTVTATSPVPLEQGTPQQCELGSKGAGGKG